MSQQPILCRAAMAILATATLMSTFACGRSHDPTMPKVIVLGFDGMDHELTSHMMAEGRLPNLSRLASQGGSFGSLGTAVPPQSPVAWSDFITGMDSGGHGIFDFVHRDADTMLPFLSTSREVGEEKFLEIGDEYRFPYAASSMELLRQGTTFWEVLENHRVETTIVRMPANFPPSGKATRELSGMGTPDILGTSGTFSFYTTELFAFDGEDISGGEVYEVWAEDGVLDAKLYALDNPFKQKEEKLEANFTVYIDEDEPVVRIVVWQGDRKDENILSEVVLTEGEWGDWVPVEFEMIPGMTLNAITRFYLKQVRPELELYASPLNIDPLDQEMQISHPESYAEDLAHVTGRFYTQEMPEDTKALTGDVFSVDEFLEQTRIAQDQYERQFRYVLDQYQGGFLFYYFGNLDQVSHMMWRSMDPDHPVYDEERDGSYAHVIPEIYERFDAIVGETLAKIDDDTLLIIMSDHGFTSWRRTFHLNTWLEENGYLTLKDPNRRDAGFFTNVDWPKTRAYGMGLNGLYINVQGRERDGIVSEQERLDLMAEIGAKLLEVRDPSTNELAITRVYPREEYYQSRGYLDIGPDIQVGYAKRTRGSAASAMGEVGPDVLTDNDGWWSGDHCMDHTAVPGILVSNRPLKKKADSLKNLAASILAEYGIEDFPPHTSQDGAGTENGGS